MKIVLAIFMIAMFPPLAIGDEKALRYENFIFSPNYQSNFDGLKDELENELSEFHYVERIYTAASDGNGLALYRVNVKKDRAVDFARKVSYKEVVLKQKRDETDRTSWDAVSFVSQSREKKYLLKTNKYNDFFSVSGRRDYDYYGCIDDQPAYTATLIEGQPDFFFVLMATEGNPADPTVLDHIELALISHDGEKQFVEKIFWGNYRPSSSKKVYFYGEGLPNSKFGEMPIDDGFGRKRYAKMYIADLDKDNQLDILFWFKTYKSTSFAEKKGFRFEKESFVLYRENIAHIGFEKSAIENEKALSLLTDNEFTWGNGYPQDNSLCKDWRKDYPMMLYIVDS